jgi:O-Antigen ligase
MTNPKTKTDNSKSKTVLLFENILFVCCIVVIALRATSSEAPTSQSAPIQAAINDTVYSLCFSGTLIFAFLLWCLVKLFSERPTFKITAMGTGLAILVTGLILATFCAANKRAAITSAVTLIAPILMAIMLAHLLDSHAKIKILLIALASLGIVAAFASADQFFVENDIVIQQYQDDPDAILQPLGIQKNSFNHILLEHRIYSKDVRSYFTTGNSAGSFAILTSFAAIAILAELLKNRKSYPSLSGNRTLAAIVLAVVLFGLFVTRSKGAVSAFLIAVAIFAFLLRSARPKLSKNIILAGCFVGVIALACAVAWYGNKFDRLPGGNSMLVRWQYWNASAKMFLDHRLTGIGGGNFQSFYPQYKPSAAPETVSDPHCFVLSILTQFGPLALLGFLIIILSPLWRTSLADPKTLQTPPNRRFANLAILCSIVTAIVIILLRPFILPRSTAETFDEKIFVLFTAYIAPAAAFAVGFALLVKTLQTSPKEYNLQNTRLTAAALFCGILGVVIHNLIDFAIFEPGILTAFFAALACLIALNTQTKNQQKSAISSPLWLKSAAVMAALTIGFAYFNYALIPVAKSAAGIAKARPAVELGQAQLAHYFLDVATDDDPLGPDAPVMNGRLYIQNFYRSDVQKEQIFNNAEQALFTAAQRNPQDYKNFDALAEMYSLYARLQPEQNEAMLNKALDSASVAVSLYPGDADLRLRLAQIAEDLGRTDFALQNYKTAVQIENGFREQFKIMYPDRKAVSRLDEDKYFFATQRINDLEQKPSK